MHQLQRSPDRLKWKVDVGTSDETEALKTLNRFRHRVKKFNIIDPLQASYQQQYNPISPMEDIFLPVRPNSMTDVELMTGATSGDKMDSTKYYMQKFHNNLRVPMSYRGYEDQVSNDVNRRGRLSNQSMLYARALRRVQRSLRIGLRTMMEIHLTLLNPDVENSPYDWRKDGQDFEIVMEPVSYLEEIDRLEGMNSRVTLAGAMLALVPPLTLGAQAALNNDEWQRYVFKEILRLPEHVMDALYKEAKSQPPASGLPTPQPENRNGASLVFKTIEKLRDRKQLSEAEFHAFSALVETNPSNAARLRAFSRDISEARASRVDIDLPKAGQKMKDNVNDADQTVERSR